MTRYFVMANIWLGFAIILLLGRTTEHADPILYGFFHKGIWSPAPYNLFLLALIALSGLYFIFTWKTRPRSTHPPSPSPLPPHL